jgi:hypothetical protein
MFPTRTVGPLEEVTGQIPGMQALHYDDDDAGHAVVEARVELVVEIM